MAIAARDVEARAADILDEVERAVIGKRPQIELVLMGLLADGHVLIEDFPGLAKTLIARSVATCLLDEVLAHPVHARPDALGRHGLGDLRPARCRLPLPAGPRLREPPPRRRDQSRPAEDAGSAPRGHAGAAGDGRRAHPSAGAAVHRARDPEPDRVRRHVSIARGPARSIPDAYLGRVSGQGRRAAASPRARRAAGRRGRAAGRLRPGDAARASAGGRGGARLGADRLVHGRHRVGHARRSADPGGRLAARVAGAAQARALLGCAPGAGTSSPPRT